MADLADQDQVESIRARSFCWLKVEMRAYVSIVYNVVGDGRLDRIDRDWSFGNDCWKLKS